MPAFSYTSATITNLAAGVSASMGDIQGGFVDLRTFINGGTMDETNVPNLSAAFTTYKRIATAATEHAGATTGGFLLQQGARGTNILAGSGALLDNHLIYLDPTIYAANLRVTKLNLRIVVVPNGTAPGVNYVGTLHPVGSYGGAAAGGTPFIATAGTAVTGSSATVTAPGANALSTGTSGDFNFPSAGGYVLAVTPSGTAPTNNVSHIVAHLEMRQV